MAGSVNVENPQCVYCKKSAVTKRVKCENCNSCVHNSCAVKSTKSCCEKQSLKPENQPNSDEGKANLENDLFIDAEDDLAENSKVVEIKYLKMLVQELTSKNKLLEENQLLLKEKIQSLEEKVKKIDNTENNDVQKVNQLQKSRNVNTNMTEKGEKPAVIDVTSQPVLPPITTKPAPKNFSNTKMTPSKQTTTRHHSQSQFDRKTKGTNSTAKPEQKKTANNNSHTKLVVQMTRPETATATQVNDSVTDDAHALLDHNNIDNVLKDEKQNGGWKIVNSRKRTKSGRPKPIQGTCEETSGLTVADKKCFLFVSGLGPEVTSDQILSYLEGKQLKNGCSCEKIKTRKDKYVSSFKLRIPREQQRKYMEPETWPKGVQANHFLNIQRPRIAPTNQPWDRKDMF